MALRKPIVLNGSDLEQLQSGDTLNVDAASVFNDSGADVDLRIEGDTATNLLVCDAGADSVFVGTTVPGAITEFTPAAVNVNGGMLSGFVFQVFGNAGANRRVFVADAANYVVRVSDADGVAGGIAAFSHADGTVLNESGGDRDFRVEGDTAERLLMVDAGLDAVQIGTGTAGTILDARASSVVFNEPGDDRDLRVEGDTAENLLVVDAGLDAVQIGTGTAGTILDARAAGVVFNEDGADRDFRVEGDSLPYLLAVQGDSSLENVALLAASSPDYQSMDRGMFWGNVSTVPTGNPAGGIFVYVESGVPKMRMPNGTVIDLSASGGGTNPPDIKVFTSSGTWTKPSGAVTVAVHLIGAGGGGGSGRRGATTNNRSGGGGGGGGGYAFNTFAAGALSATEDVHVGSGGVGGAAIATDNTDGNAGSAGGNTKFGPNGSEHLIAGGGGGGGAGTASAGAGGSGGTGNVANGGAGGNGGDAAAATSGTAGGSVAGRMAGAGGGGGGGVTSGGNPVSGAAGGSSGGNGGRRGDGVTTGLPDTVAAYPGQDAQAGAAVIGGTTPALFGGGGGGGGGLTNGSGTAPNLVRCFGEGGAGGFFGGGGGGGGLGVNGQSVRNNGGTGAPGLAIVITFFA